MASTLPACNGIGKQTLVKELSDQAIELHVKHGTQLPTMHSTMHLYPVNGAVHRVGAQDTAWNYRDVIWSEVIVGVDPDPANKDRIIAWARDYWDALHPFRRWRSLCELYDGRGRGSCSRHIR